MLLERAEGRKQSGMAYAYEGLVQALHLGPSLPRGHSSMHREVFIDQIFTSKMVASKSLIMMAASDPQNLITCCVLDT